MIILTVLAVAYTLAIARPFLMPVAFAWLARLALAPLITFAHRLRINVTLAAALIVVTLTGAGFYGLYRFSEPATEWAQRLPHDIRDIKELFRREFGDVDDPIKQVTEAGKAVQEITDGTPERDRPVKVAVVNETPAAQLLGGLWDFVANIVIIATLLFFLLAAEDRFLAKIVSVMPRLRDAKAAVTTVRNIERSVSRYLATVTAVNLVLGAIVGLICWGFDLPNPALWGVVAAIFNFVPYLGALAGVGIVAVVGVTSLDSLTDGLWPAILYAVVNGIEGMVVTPLVLGRRLALSSVFLFAWLLLMSWLWGIPGSLIAVPMLAVVKIICDSVPRLHHVGSFLGR